MKTIEIRFVCMGGVHATIFKEKLQSLMKDKERCIIKMCSPQDVIPCDLIVLLPMLAYRKKDLEKFVRKNIMRKNILKSMSFLEESSFIW